MEYALPDTRLQQSRTTGGGVRRFSESIYRKNRQAKLACQGHGNDQDCLRDLLGRGWSICVATECRACLHQSSDDSFLRSGAALRECEVEYSESTRRLEGREFFLRRIRIHGWRTVILLRSPQLRCACGWAHRGGQVRGISIDGA